MNFVKKLWEKLILSLFGSGMISRLVDKIVLVVAGVLSQIPGLAPDAIEQFSTGLAQLLLALTPIVIQMIGKWLAKGKE